MAFKNKRMMTFGIDPEYYDLLNLESSESNISIAELIRSIIRDYYDRSPKDKPMSVLDRTKVDEILRQINDLRECLNLILGGLQ